MADKNRDFYQQLESAPISGFEDLAMAGSQYLMNAMFASAWAVVMGRW